MYHLFDVSSNMLPVITKYIIKLYMQVIYYLRVDFIASCIELLPSFLYASPQKQASRRPTAQVVLLASDQYNDQTDDG